MNNITLGAGDAATAPWWAKHPELDVSSDETELFMFPAKIGCGSKPVEVVAKMYLSGECSEIVAVLVRGVEDIANWLETSVHEELAKLAETKFHARAEEDAA